MQNLIKTYQENIWTDEINLFRYETEIANKQQEIKEIEKKLKAKYAVDFIGSDATSYVEFWLFTQFVKLF